MRDGAWSRPAADWLLVRQASMFGLGEKLKNAAAAGSAMAFAIGLALMGIVWLSIAAFTLLKTVLVPEAAMAIVGAVALAPLLFMLVRHRASPRPQSEPEEKEEPPQDVNALVRLAHSASLLGERSPIAGVALTLGAAFLAARSPQTSPLAVHMLAEAVERWARPTAPPPSTGD